MIIAPSGSYTDPLRAGAEAARREALPLALPPPERAQSDAKPETPPESRFPALTAPGEIERLLADGEYAPARREDGLGGYARRALTTYQQTEQAGRREQLTALIGIDTYA